MSVLSYNHLPKLHPANAAPKPNTTVPSKAVPISNAVPAPNKTDASTVIPSHAVAKSPLIEPLIAVMAFVDVAALAAALVAPPVIAPLIAFIATSDSLTAPIARDKEPIVIPIALRMLIFPSLSTSHFATKSANLLNDVFSYNQFPTLNPTTAVVIAKDILALIVPNAYSAPSLSVPIFCLRYPFIKVLVSSLPPCIHLNAPIAITTVSRSNSVRKSIPPSNTSDHDIFFKAVNIVSSIPSTQPLIAFANFLKSKFWKNPLIPDAIDKPRSSKSKLSVKLSDAVMAVFNEFAMVFPVA